MTTRTAIVRFLAIFALVTALFMALEILPLHYGPRHLPWGELLPAVRERALRMALVAVAVAGFLTWKGGKTDGAQPPGS